MGLERIVVEAGKQPPPERAEPPRLAEGDELISS
jgi:hypothetical protein